MFPRNVMLIIPLSENPRMTKEWPSRNQIAPQAFLFESFQIPHDTLCLRQFCISDIDLNSPRNKKETGAEMGAAIVSGIVTGEFRPAIGQFVSLSLATVPEVFVSKAVNHNTISLLQNCESN